MRIFVLVSNFLSVESRKGFWWKIFLCFKQQAKKMSLIININLRQFLLVGRFPYSCSHCNVLHLSIYGFGVHCWIVPKDDSSCYNINLLHQVINIVDEFDSLVHLLFHSENYKYQYLIYCINTLTVYAWQNYARVIDLHINV